MEQYQGIRSGDQISGGFAYIRENGMGLEVCNFSQDKGSLYGNLQIRGDHINLQRIGANNDDDFIEGTTIVWTANRPSGGTVIVGWYKNATVYRNRQQFKKAPVAQLKNDVDGYWIKAPFDNATLLPVDARTFEIPRQVKGSMGRSAIWYADSPESVPLVNRVRALIKNKHMPKSSGPKHSKTQDQEKKVAVEKAAIRSCCAYFENLGYEVVSVEKDNVGWDLVATTGKTSLRIEVKGLSGAMFSIELTPNEYNAFTEQAIDYRLAVVVNALEVPSLSICRYSNEQGAWIIEDEEGRALEVKVKQSASISCI
jgi:hypothetical protein